MNAFIDQFFCLDNQVAIITGSSRGIGLAVAEGFAASGAHVAVVSRNEEEAESAANQIVQKFHTKAIGVRADVSNSHDVDHMVNQVKNKLGAPDILMTNAGIINRPRQNAYELDEETWDRIIDINLKGTFLCCSRVLNEMIPRKKGKIICMASIMSLIAQTGHSPYIASKGGISQLVKALALEAAPFNINVNAVGPTYIRTELVDVTLQDQEKNREILSKLPLGRIGEPEDVVGACIFLASKASDFITGHLLMIDGGHTIH